MKLFIGSLLLLTFSNVLGSKSRQSRQNGGANSGNTVNNNNSNSNSLNNSSTIVSNKTITHSTNLDVDLKHLVVDRNTGRVSSNEFYVSYNMVDGVFSNNVLKIPIYLHAKGLNE